MEFNNTTTKAGIIQDCEFWLFSSNYGQISSDANMLATFTSLSNQALNTVVTAILGADDRWQFDDTNYTDYPIATTDLVLNQRDYVLSVDQLQVIRVEVKDPNGNWLLLNPIDLVDMSVARDEYLSTPSVPIQYDKEATSLFLYPKPNYNSVGGLRVYYQRDPSYFTSSDTSKKPGFVTTLHRMVPLLACLDYAVANNLTDKINVLTNEIAKKNLSLSKFYGRRDRDEVLVLREINPGYYPQSY